MFKHIINNLISNSLKFSEPDTNINIDINSDSEQLKISVQDFGKGVAKEEQKFIFEPFFRGKSSIGIIPGTGIGLAIVKKFVSILEGEINLVSEENKGSTFIITFPINPLNK